MNLNTHLDFDLRSFFRWWRRELTFLVPEKLRQFFSESKGLAIVAAYRDDLSLCYQRAGHDTIYARFSLNPQGIADFQQFKAEHPDLEKARYVLRLGAAQALARIVYLPIAAQENLQQVVAFELDRYTPYKPEQVFFSAKLLATVEETQLQVLLVVSPKTVLESALAHLKTFAIQPSWIDCEHAANDFDNDPKPYNLLPEHLRPRSHPLTQWLGGLLTSLLVLLTLAVFVLPVWMEGMAVDELRDELRRLEKQARVVEAQQHDIEAMQQEMQRLISLKQDTPLLVEMLNALSGLMANDTWLTHLQYSERQLQIQGQSPTASALIGVLEDAPMFSQASFVSPLTQDKATGLERFQISVTVNALKPEPDADAETSDDAAAQAEQGQGAEDATETADETEDNKP